MTSQFIIVFLVLIFTSYLLNKTILRFVKTLGIRGNNNISVRWSKVTKPSLGGITFYIIFLIAIVIFSLISPENQMTSSKTALGLFSTATIAFILGLADDAYNTNPFIKLTGQVSCGIIFVVTNNQIDFFSNPEIDSILTVLWVIGIMNSINMLDNMDGISTITSIGILLSCFIISFYNHPLNLNNFLIMGVIASLIGFLYFNFHPSKMFMGDTGSQFLGVIIAYFGVHYCWNIPADYFRMTEHPYLLQISMVMIVFALPMMDTITVTVNRLYRGNSPMIGGKDHTTHYLSRSGLGDQKVAVFFIIFSVLQSLVVLIFLEMGSISPYVYISSFIIYFIIMIIFGLMVTKKERK